jgi:CBS domain-containing protein
MACQLDKLVHEPIESLEQRIDIQKAARFMAERNLGSVVVTEDDRVIGLFTESDLIKRVVGPGKHPKSVTLGDACTRNLVTISADASCVEAIKTMHSNRCRRLLVYRDEKFLGVTTLPLVARAMANQDSGKNLLLNTVVGITVLVTLSIIVVSVYHFPDMMRLAEAAVH